MNGITQALYNNITALPRWSFVVKLPHSSNADTLCKALEQKSGFKKNPSVASFIKVLNDPLSSSNLRILQLPKNLTRAELNALEQVLPTTPSSQSFVIILDDKLQEFWMSNAKFWTRERFLEYQNDTVNYAII